ncbi:MAG: trypsin-like serine peptidase, partial [Acidimicrobiia bacterium]
IRAIEDQARRTARIQRRGTAVGTGVLVGDDLLLTAGHVLAIEVWPPDVDGLEAVFDFNSSAGGSFADSGIPTTVDQPVFGFGPSDAEIKQTVGDQDDAPSGKLDFVVVKLDREIGLLPADRPRGFYGLDESEYDLGKAPAVRIVSHPAGNWATASDIVGTIKATPKGTRIRYVTNTTPGSSGAPIVDGNGRLVGIHTYGTATGNRGVPFSLISKLLKESEHAALFQPRPAGAAVTTKSASPFSTTVLGGYPLVDRKPLREKLKDMATDDQGYRHLAIAGGARMGKSYSFTLISHIAAESGTVPDLLAVAPSGIDAVLIDLRHYSGFALDELLGEVSRVLLMRTGLLKPEEKFAIHAQVAKTVIDLLNTSPVLRAPGKQWWICFDSVDDAARLRASGVLELIGGIIGLTNDLQLRIRVVLGGQQVTDLLNELGLTLPNQESPGNLLPEHVLEWVQEEAKRKGRQIETADLRTELDTFVGEELESDGFPEEGLPP